MEASKKLFFYWLKSYFETCELQNPLVFGADLEVIELVPVTHLMTSSVLKLTSSPQPHPLLAVDVCMCESV